MRWVFWCLVLVNALVFVGAMGSRLLGSAGEGIASDAGVLAGVNTAAADADDRSQSQCVTVGPFVDEERAGQFVARLAVLEVASQMRSVELSEGAGYWVYLKPKASRDAARRHLAELQGRGIDSYLIPRGDLENGISLGVFSRQPLAEARVRELSAQGLEAQLREIDRTYREIWVTLPRHEMQKLAASVWQHLVHEVFSLQERQNFCLDVASSENIH